MDLKGSGLSLGRATGWLVDTRRAPDPELQEYTSKYRGLTNRIEGLVLAYGVWGLCGVADKDGSFKIMCASRGCVFHVLGCSVWALNPTRSLSSTLLLFLFRAPLLKPNSRKKSALIIKGLLRNQA